MSKVRMFGTDGVRGIANDEITPELAFNLGKAAATILKDTTSEKSTFIVGADTRISGDMLSNSLISGLLSSGADVINVGVIPTPAISFLVKRLHATAGVMISASHNPYNYNGIKFFNADGYKLSDSIEDEMQNLIESNFTGITPCIDSQIGVCRKAEDYDNVYASFISSTLSSKSNLKGLNIALDCGNGATYKIAKPLFESLGANVTAINTQPNGININKNCGSTHLEQLKNLVVSESFDMGFAFDGDGDRCLAVDNTGATINGDKILSICGEFMKNNNTLKKNTIVATVMSNLGLTKAMDSLDIQTIHAKVGDRYVLEEMIKHGYNLGGEESGHVIFFDHNTTGDGLLTALQLANICKISNKSLFELSSKMVEYPQTLINVSVPNNIKNDIFKNPLVSSTVEKEEARLNGDGRVLVRVSGTEPLIRVMVEGACDNLITDIATNIANSVKSAL